MESDQNKKVNPRALAADILTTWLETEKFPDRLIPKKTDDRAFLMELVYGTVKRKRSIEWIIGNFASQKQENFIKACLMIGIYQIYFMDDVAEYAAVNETVAVAKKVKGKPVSGFVNGVLRNAIRKKDSISTNLDGETIAIQESHPDILVDKWLTKYGNQQTHALCMRNNEPATTVIRVNLLKTTVEEFIATAQESGIDMEPHPFAPEQCLILPRGKSVIKIPGFDEGLFNVQDPSGITAVNLLDPKPGEHILDACAAPGGKTIFITEIMKGEGKITAMDLYDDRLPRLVENQNRMGMDIVDIIQGDAASKDDLKKLCKDHLFDRILLDVPCSNTGVLQRRPDARWRFTMERLASLASLQYDILSNASQFVKPKGTIVYSTCSLEAEEGEDLISEWLDEHKDFEMTEEKCIFPPDTNTDGAYAAAIVRK